MAIPTVNPLIKVIAIPLVVILVGFGIIHLFSSSSQKSSTHNLSNLINNNATADSNVETLKTLTAEMSAVEQQNAALQKENKTLQDKDKANLEQYKSGLLQDVQQEVTSSLQTANQTSQDNINHALANIKNGVVSSNGEASNTKDTTNPNNGNANFIWISDESQNTLSTSDFTNTLLPTTNAAINNINKTDLDFSPKSKPLPVPYYTLPVNATLTGAIAMQPLIGRIPIDGKVPDPYTFKAIIGPKNLAANGVDIPAAIQGIVVSGILEGDMLGSCVRGDITAMTFVFQDGTISTSQAQSGEALGNIAAADGNPCILGVFHTNAPEFLGAQAALAGLQGYGNALSQAQVSNVVSPTNGGSISSLVGNANTYAIGQGASSSAQAMQRWWDQRVQNSFDFVFVPNVDPKTKQLLTLNINITKEIPIDYDPNGRKVFYEHKKNSFIVQNLD